MISLGVRSENGRNSLGNFHKFVLHISNLQKKSKPKAFRCRIINLQSIQTSAFLMITPRVIPCMTSALHLSSFGSGCSIAPFPADVPRMWCSKGRGRMAAMEIAGFFFWSNYYYRIMLKLPICEIAMIMLIFFRNYVLEPVKLQETGWETCHFWLQDCKIFKQVGWVKFKKTNIYIYIIPMNIKLAILCDLLGMVKWPFQKFEVTLGDQKFTYIYIYWPSSINR